MDMEKASERDMRAAVELSAALDALGHRLVPTMPCAIASVARGEKAEAFDRDDDAQCGRALRHLLDIADRASLSRVVWGMVVVLDPKNKIVDPSSDVLRIHPDVRGDLKAADQG